MKITIGSTKSELKAEIDRLATLLKNSLRFAIKAAPALVPILNSTPDKEFILNGPELTPDGNSVVWDNPSIQVIVSPFEEEIRVVGLGTNIEETFNAPNGVMTKADLESLLATVERIRRSSLKGGSDPLVDSLNLIGTPAVVTA